MTTRLAKISLVAGVGVYLALVSFNNLTDYVSNYEFVRHVLLMDTTFPGNAGMWRAIDTPWVFHAFYWSIIGWEIAACGLTMVGTWLLWKARGESAASFNRSKGTAVAGLTVNLLQWLLAFIAVGGEWFLMWQSPTWNGGSTAGRMFVVVGIVLLFVNTPDDD